MNEFSTLMADLETALASVAPTRQVSRSLKDREQFKDSELQAGVFTLISTGHRNFLDFLGESAAYGTHRVLIVGQCMVAQSATGADLEDAEFALFEDVRSMARSSLPSTLSPMKIIEMRQSGQVDHPYGFIAVTLDMGTN